MKILHVVPWYEPAWKTGGTAVAVSILCRGLVAKGIDVTVYTTDDAGEKKYLDIPLNEPVELGGVKVWYFHCDSFMKKKEAFYSSSLLKKLKSTVLKNFDLIHVSSTRHWHGFGVYRSTRDIPYIISPHGSLMESHIRTIGNKYLKLLYLHLVDARFIKGAVAINYLCEGERQSSQNYSFDKPSFLVPNGIAINDFECVDIRVKLCDRYNVPRDSTLLLYLGRIHPQKNIHFVIEALNILKAKHKNVFLFIVGAISDQEYYQYLKHTVSNYKLDLNVKFFPPVKRDEVKSWYSISDLMVLPSESEGLSMSIIESLYASLPVLVSSRVANYREIEADNAGIVVDPTQESVTEALRTILVNPNLLKKLSQNARKSAENRYDINKVASLMIKAYEDVLSGRRSPELKWM